MAITCSWEKPLGTCYSKYDTELKEPIMIWGGGNCPAVFTVGKHKDLVNFIADDKHFKAMEYKGDEYIEIIISYARKREAKKLINLLISANFEFQTTNDILEFKY